MDESGDYSGTVTPRDQRFGLFSKSTQTRVDLPELWRTPPSLTRRNEGVCLKTKSEDNILLRPRDSPSSGLSRQESSSSQKLVILHKTMLYRIKKRQWKNKQNHRKQTKKGGNEFFTKIKLCSVFIAKWSIRMLQILMHLGTAAKKSVTNLYKIFETKHRQPCKCTECREKIEEITRQIRRLGENLEILAKNGEKLERFRGELEQLKLRINDGASVCSTPFLPPQPPPLPPPQAMMSCSATSVTDKKKTKENDPRPVIKLEDILKVKLKKISLTNIH